MTLGYMAVAENMTQTVINGVQTPGNIPVISSIGGMIHSLLSSVLPGREWLLVLALAGLTAWIVIKKLKEGVITSTALWVGATIVIFLALKYVGL